MILQKIPNSFWKIVINFCKAYIYSSSLKAIFYICKVYGKLIKRGRKSKIFYIFTSLKASNLLGFAFVRFLFLSVKIDTFLTMSQPKTSGRSSFGFMMRPLTWLCMCFDAAAEGDQRRRSKNKLLRRSNSVHSMKPSPINSFDRSPMVDDEERDEKIKDVILYCKMNSPLNLH